MGNVQKVQNDRFVHILINWIRENVFDAKKRFIRNQKYALSMLFTYMFTM
jgi:hypothetical protein